MTAYKCLQNKTKNCKRTFKVFDIANSRCTQSVLVYQQQMLTIIQLYDNFDNSNVILFSDKRFQTFPTCTKPAGIPKGERKGGWLHYIYNYTIYKFLQTYVC